MRTLFPAIKANSEITMQVSALHSLYVAEYGNPQGVPVLMLHDGPGGNGQAILSRLCDPQRFRIIIVDQRGCGRSEPYGELHENDTWLLLQDLDQLRQQLAIDRWLLWGDSWGAGLALAYAIDFPQRALAMLLHAPFLGRRQDLQWRYAPDGGAAQILPDHYQQFLHALPLSARQAPLAGYQALLSQGNELEQLAAAKAWSIWRGELAHLRPSTDPLADYGQTHNALSLAHLECHYYHQGCFWDEGHILNNLHKINTLPCTIVHGRYDMLCKMEAAQSLADNWPGSQLQIVPAAGHALSEAGVVDGLIHASEAMADWLYGDKH